MASSRVKNGLRQAIWVLSVITSVLGFDHARAETPQGGVVVQPADAFVFPLEKGEKGASVRLVLPNNYKPLKSMSQFKRKGVMDFMPDNAPPGPGRENVILTRDFAGPKVLTLTTGLLDAVEEGLLGIGATILGRQTENLGGYVRTSLAASYTKEGRTVVVCMVYYGGSSGEVIGLQWARPVFQGETPQEVLTLLQNSMQTSFVIA